MAKEQVSHRSFGGPFPEHIAIIMDGNGRWAEERGMMRVLGHGAGVASVREITTECARMGVKSLTLYTFSIENWRRPAREVRYLMRLLRIFMHRERRTLMDNDVRLQCIGRLDELPEAVAPLLEAGDVVVTMSSGPFAGLPRQLLQALEAREEQAG